MKRWHVRSRPQIRVQRLALAISLALALLVGLAASAGQVQAATPVVNPQSDSVGLEGTISAPAPTQAATIVTPVNGRNFTTLPVTIAGLCPQGTMVKIFSNNIFIGSVQCTNNSYSLQVDLFSGQNELVARVYDDLDQAGPDSAKVTVTFNDAQSANFESRPSITSNFAKKGANTGQVLSWPLILSGGTGPYAVSVDWGDGKPVTLKSVPFTGTFNVDHVYDTAGIYRIIVKVSDSKGNTAYLQLIGVGNGAVGASGTNTKDSGSSTVTVVQTKYSIIPSLIAIPLVLSSFWLGRKYELQVLRRRIEDSTSAEYTR